MNDAQSRHMLALNMGSSSLKFGLHLMGAHSSRMLATRTEKSPSEPRTAVARIAVRLAAAQGLPAPLAIGHRIVHDGRLCRRHTLIDATVAQQLEAATAAALGGVDLLVFTGGIGQNDAATRAGICEGLAWLGIRTEPALDGLKEPSSKPASVRVMPSKEDEQIAWRTWQLTT